MSKAFINVGISSITIVYDTAAPNVSISTPSVSGESFQRANIGESLSVTSFGGSDSDTGSLAAGVKRVQLRLSYLLNGASYYWDGANFSSTTVNANTAWRDIISPPATWAYTTDMNWPTPNSQSLLILMEARAEDKSTAADGTPTGNVGATASVSFNLDDQPPTGSIAWPSANAAISSASIHMTGAEADDLAGVQITQLEISTGTGSKSYWTGSTWTVPGSQTWITTTTAASWNYTIPSVALVSDQLYYLRAQFIDFAGNIFTTQITTFTYDTTAPTVVISTPANGAFYSVQPATANFSGSTIDNGTNPTGISTVTLTLQDVTASSTPLSNVPAGGNPLPAGRTCPRSRYVGTRTNIN